MLESVLHGVARRELMLMLRADNDVPLRIATTHIGHQRHRVIIIVDAQLAIGTRKG